MPISLVTLADMLACREARANAQRALRARFGLPLVSLSMNIPGPQKNSPLIALGFAEGVRRLRAYATPVYEELRDAPTGPEGLFVLDLPAAMLKAATMEMEARDPLGRLLDMDVLDVDGQKLARPTPRTCLICDSPAAVCARSRAHGLAALTDKTQSILMELAVSHHADLAWRALCMEALVTPKPGLVDGANNGAHTDMCLSTLLMSANALRPYFRAAVRAGLTEAQDAPLLQRLRQEGLLAEAAMLRATGGVNTHKGAVYGLGLLLGAQGRCLRAGGDVWETAAALAGLTVDAALRAAAQTPRTHGETAYARYGATGARGEAAAGFPHARLAADALGRHACRGENEAAALALLEVMAVLPDTNLLHRGGPAGLAWAQAKAQALCVLPVDERLGAVIELDAQMNQKNLSPGGAADMLALGLYMYGCTRFGSF